MTLAADLIRYLGGLTLTGGDRDGEPFTVLPWENRFVRGAFGVKGPAGISVGRGSGKSALVAGIAAAVADPDGPLHGNRREVVCVASSFDQSRVIFEDVLGFLRHRHDIGKRSDWRVQDSANRAVVEYRATGARVRCIGSDPAKAHGLRPALALIDEPAQHDAAKTDRMFAAIRTGLGKVPNSKLIALGTRPADPAHWFSKLLAGGAAYAQVHAARPGDPPFRASTWRKANPSFDHLPSLAAEIREEAAQARRDPGLLAGFEALRLNLGTADTEVQTLLDPGLWKSIEGTADVDGPAVWGVDLGTSAAQSAVAAYWPQTGALACLAAFPAEPTLAERGLRDGVGGLYAECARRGELLTLGRHTVDVTALLQAALDRFGRPARRGSSPTAGARAIYARRWTRRGSRWRSWNSGGWGSATGRKTCGASARRVRIVGWSQCRRSCYGRRWRKPARSPTPPATRSSARGAKGGAGSGLAMTRRRRRSWPLRLETGNRRLPGAGGGMAE